MKNKTFLILIGVLIIIFLLLLFWPTKKKEETLKSKQISEQLEPVPELSMDYPTLIKWNIATDKGYSKTEVLKTSNEIAGVDKKLLIKNNVIVEGSEFYFNDNKNSFEHNVRIENSEQLEKGLLKDNEIKTIFFETIAKLKLTANMEVKIEETSYLIFLYPWWVSSNESEADAIKMVANYYYKNIPVKTFEGYVIKAIYFTNGKLVKMEFQLPFVKVDNSVEKNLWTLNEIKKIETDKIKIWNIDGGRDYELEGSEEKISEVTINDYNLEYIFDSKKGVMWPYYFLKGESNLKTGKAVVTLIVSAVKE